jgi:membrane protein required for colicin V production
MFSETFAAVAGPYITLDPPYNEWAALFGAYLFFTFVAFGAARILNRGIEKAEMKEFNRHLGATFGLLKGVVVALVLTFFIATLPSMHETIKNSKSGRIAARIMNHLHPAMPEKLHAALEKYIHSLDDVSVEGPLFQDENGNEDPLAKAVKDAAQALEDKGTEIAEKVRSKTSLPRRTDPQEEPSNPFEQPSFDDSDDKPHSAPYAGVKSSIPGQKGTSSTPASRSSVPKRRTEVDDEPTTTTFWSDVRGALGDDAQSVLVDALENLDPATKEKMQSQLLEIVKGTGSTQLPELKERLLEASAKAVPDLISSLSRQSSANQGTSNATAAAERERLLVEISELRSSFPQVQSRIQAEVRGLVAGVPDIVVIRALHDWKADLSHEAVDPDDQTDATTAIETRLLRQMEKARLRPEDLATEVQERLSAGADSGLQLR